LPRLASAVVILFTALPPAIGAADQAREALQKAATLTKEGRLTEAAEQAERALSDPETRAVASSVLGTIRLQQNRLDESARLLQDAIRLEPRMVGAHLNLAQVYVLQGSPERAVPVYQQVLALDPRSAPARMALAHAEAEKGNYKRSLELAGPALPAFKESPEGLLVLATDYLKTQDQPKAAALLDDARRLPDAPSAWWTSFGDILTQGGLVSKALEAYDMALGLEPASLTALQRAAVVAEQHDELERSLSYWMRAKRIAPDDPPILLGFGRVCLKMDLLEDAEPPLLKAAGLRPGEATYQYTLVVAKVGKRQYEAAQALLEPLVEKQPGDAQLQYALGSVLYMQGHLEEAAVRLQESLRLEPGQVASHYYLALVARDQGRDAEAIERLEELLRRHPDHAPSCEALGGLLLADRRYPEAERLLRKAVALNPRSVKATYQLGLLLSRTGRKEEGDKQLELSKSLRQEDDKTSRLQLRLLDPEG
jgi:tetratricopeptide (TPR) repeat protein